MMEADSLQTGTVIPDQSLPSTGSGAGDRLCPYGSSMPEATHEDE